MTKSGRETNKALKVLHDFTNGVISARREAKKKEGSKSSNSEEDKEDELIGKKKRLAFLDLLLESTEDGKELSDESIREEVDTFMFEGHDTTAANMAFTIYLMAAYPDIQRRVQDEIDAVIGGDPDAQITMEDLSSMKYLESVIKESLRLYPSVPLNSRTLYEDAVIEVQITIKLIHRIL